MKKTIIKVLIVDDCLVFRELLAHIIETDPELQVVKMAATGEEALKWLESESADVITMDIQMPGLNGFEVTRKIMETKPIPIVIITSGYTTANTEMAFRAIEAGALAIIEKPTKFIKEKYEIQTQEIIKTIKMISEIKLVKKQHRFKESSGLPMLPLVRERAKQIQAVAIGASLGGPLAIAEILSHLPSSFPVPIFIVQHISAGFIDGFIQWIQKYSVLPIHLAQHNQCAIPGHVYIAPDKCHMEVKKGHVIHLDHSSANSQPFIARLFHSMAYTYGPCAIGVILTGMGRDGANDLLLMRQKGAYTIAQDESSCIMFGIPREAIIIGAAQQVLPLNKIAPALVHLTKKI